MRKIIVTLFLFLYPSNLMSHMAHYNKYKKLEMEIFRNGKLIGYNHYFLKEMETRH